MNLVCSEPYLIKICFLFHGSMETYHILSYFLVVRTVQCYYYLFAQEKNFQLPIMNLPSLLIQYFSLLMESNHCTIVILADHDSYFYIFVSQLVVVPTFLSPSPILFLKPQSEPYVRLHELKVKRFFCNPLSITHLNQTHDNDSCP